MQFIVDYQKIMRTQAKVMIELKNESLKSIQKGNINCIYIDRRKNITKVKIEVERSSRFFWDLSKKNITLYALNHMASFCFTLPKKNQPKKKNMSKKLPIT